MHRNAAAFGLRRSVLNGMLALALGAGLTGCATESTCVDWVSYATAQDAYDDASLVVVGTVGEPTGSATLFGVLVPLREVAVDDVLKGESPALLEVASSPVTCSAETSPDSLETDERIAILLINDGGTWRTITPSAGVLPAPEGEPLPFDVG
jgi:hypothetical protein